MGKRIWIYQVVRPTGVFNRDGIEYTVRIGSKITRAAADELAALGKDNGDFVEKVSVDK